MVDINKSRRGFTLIEILIVLVVLGVIVGLAVPTYTGAVEQGRQNEAIVTLNTIFMGQKIYRLNNANTYYEDATPTWAELNTALNTDLTPRFYNLTWVTATATPTFSARLTRNAVEGGNGVTTATITEAGNIVWA